MGFSRVDGGEYCLVDERLFEFGGGVFERYDLGVPVALRAAVVDSWVGRSFGE